MKIISIHLILDLKIANQSEAANLSGVVETNQARGKHKQME
jgi:hypothetical protein